MTWLVRLNLEISTLPLKLNERKRSKSPQYSGTECKGDEYSSSYTNKKPKNAALHHTNVIGTLEMAQNNKQNEVK